MSKLQKKQQANIGFDCEKYLTLQSENILKRIDMFNNKLYLEFGGKLFDDLHAARVLPGFDPNIKTKLLLKLKDKAEIIFCISANDIEKNKIRADIGVSYDNEVLRLVDNLRSIGLFVSAIVITLFKGQPNAEKFANKLRRRGERVFIHAYTKGYPNDVNTIVSDEGYGAQPFIETERPLVIITAPGPNSGKLATCLTELYHEYKRGNRAGYAKFETFPVWNLRLKHPVNIAYEAATADIGDVNQIDPYHFNAYEKISINYNRDVAVFPVVSNIIKKITGEEIYKSPTDMGVNMVGFAIEDNAVVEEAAKKEIVRRYHRAKCDYLLGRANAETIERLKYLMGELGLTELDINCIKANKIYSQKISAHCVSIELKDGSIVNGVGENCLSAAGDAVLKALCQLAGIKGTNIIPKDILMPIIKLRKNYLGMTSNILSLDDVLVTLSITAETNENARHALEHLGELAGCEAHSTFILIPSEEYVLKRLKVNITCEPQFNTTKLFVE